MKPRAHSGLGRSQTAEVAYLDRQEAKYEEHDIKDFEFFMASRNPVAANNRSSGTDKSRNRWFGIALHVSSWSSDVRALHIMLYVSLYVSVYKTT